MNIEQTIEFIKKAHAEQYRKSGEPYWEHPLSVMYRLPVNATLEEKQIALLHDVLEDTNYTEQNLLELGFSQFVVVGVRALSRLPQEKNITYLDWIQTIASSKNKSIIKIKIADLEDNSDPRNINRIDNLEERKKHEEMATGRYKKALQMLRKALNDCN